MTRFGYVMTTYFIVMLIGGLSFIHITPRLIWNASASTPVGLYAIAQSPRLEVTDLVAVNAPDPLASFLAERGYLPRGVPLMKRVAALPGQQVCRTGARVTIDGITMGDALTRDRLEQLQVHALVDHAEEADAGARAAVHDAGRAGGGGREGGRDAGEVATLGGITI